jgi:hypothetical protein
MDFISTHPYLIANIPLLFLIAMSVKISWPDNYRRLSLWSGLACLPCSILALLHNGSYWNPIRLGNWPIGIEDLIFTFVTGTMAWLLAAWPYRRRLSSNIRFSVWVRRALFAGLLFGGISLLLWQAGIIGLENTLIAGMLTFLIFLFRKPALWPLAASGVLLFLPIYVFIVKIQFSIWPDYLLQWGLTGPLGSTFLGIPIGEIVYAAVFAAVWPTYIAFVCDVRMELN